MNCTELSTNSDYYLQYAVCCEEPALVALNAGLLLVVVLCCSACASAALGTLSRSAPA